MIGDHPGRAGFGETKFGMLVKVAPPGHDLGQDTLHGGVDAGRIDSLRLGCAGREQQRQGGDGEQSAHVKVP